MTTNVEFETKVDTLVKELVAIKARLTRMEQLVSRLRRYQQEGWTI